MPNIIVEEGYLVTRANEFLEELRKAFNEEATSRLGVLAVCDKLFDLLVTPSIGGGYKASVPDFEKIIPDFLDGITPKEWEELLFESSYDFTNFHASDLDGARESFLGLIGFSILSGIPEDKETALHKTLLGVCSVFNGHNQLQMKFDLKYTDYDIVKTELSETIDLSDYLIVQQPVPKIS